MKKTFIVLLSFICLSFTTKVYAQEVFYTNENGVSFTENEYEFIRKMFWEGAENLFTQDDYIRFKESNIINGEFDVNYYYPITPYATTITSKLRTLKITKSCSSDCLISVTASWNGNPLERSYDVIGARLANTNLINNNINTRAITNTNTNSSSEINKFSNGFGVSIKIPNGDNIVVSQIFRVEKKGTVYASYQHASSSISLQDSKKYTISQYGYGGVFKFSGNASLIYDQAAGVSISL